MSKQKAYESHDFYCINCGQKNIPLLRSGSQLKGKYHRKNMYCYHCKHTVNHIECRNAEEVNAFLNDYKNGVFKEEANSELSYEQEHSSFHCFCYGGDSWQR